MAQTSARTSRLLRQSVGLHRCVSCTSRSGSPLALPEPLQDHEILAPTWSTVTALSLGCRWTMPSPWVKACHIQSLDGGPCPGGQASRLPGSVQGEKLSLSAFRYSSTFFDSLPGLRVPVPLARSGMIREYMVAQSSPLSSLWGRACQGRLPFVQVADVSRNAGCNRSAARNKGCCQRSCSQRPGCK